MLYVDIPDMARTNAGFETLSQKVYEQLRESIIEGELAPGTRLVRRDLSKKLGVSTIPVMEALFRLEQDGLVESQAMFGSRVISLDEENLREEEILRTAIEAQCVRLLVENASDEEIKELLEYAREVDKIQSTSKDVATITKAHFDFHLKIAELSGCSLLYKEMQRLGFRYLMRVGASKDINRGLPKPWHEHEELVELFLKRDKQRADDVIREHIKNAVLE